MRPSVPKILITDKQVQIVAIIFSESSMLTANQVSRLAPLDTLRGIAALSVLFWHYRTGFGGSMPLYPVFAPFYESGGLAVPFFFLLSGYILAHVYMTPQRKGELGSNLFARFARMGPLHYATLVIVAVVQLVFLNWLGDVFVYQHNDARHFLLNLFFLQETGLQTGYSFNGPAWSIGAEMIVNVVFLTLIAKFARPVLWVTGIAIASLLALLGDILYSTIYPKLDRQLLGAFISFFQGVLIHLALPPTKPKSHHYDFCFAVVLIAALATMTLRPTITANLDLLIAFVYFPLMIVCAIRGPLTAQVLGHSRLRVLGYISFSLYITHFLVQCAFHAISAISPINYGNVTTLAAFVIASLLVGWLTAKYFEWPIYAHLTGRSLKPDAGEGDSRSSRFARPYSKLSGAILIQFQSDIRRRRFRSSEDRMVLSSTRPWLKLGALSLLLSTLLTAAVFVPVMLFAR
jgi:peptidoglycan/LPS O-acetylase OafA/YrhL